MLEYWEFLIANARIGLKIALKLSMHYAWVYFKYIIFRFNPFFAWLYTILCTNVLPSSGLMNFFFLRTSRTKNHFNIFTLFNHMTAATATVVFGEIYNTIQINKMHHGNCHNIFMQIVKINSRPSLKI